MDPVSPGPKPWSLEKLPSSPPQEVFPSRLGLLRHVGRHSRSLAAAVGDHLRVLPPETRVILEMLAVLNLLMPLAQLGHAAEVESPSAA